MATGVVLALATMSAVAGLPPGNHSATARAADVTISQDNLRTGWDPNEASITPAAVAGFKQRFSFAVSGQVWAQPLVIDTLPTATVIVATENDQVYGVNAATGAQLWHTSLGSPYPIKTCTDLSPNIGVTGTPVYDSLMGPNGTVYMVAQTGGSKPIWALYGVDPVTGAASKVQTISGSPTNNSHISINPGQLLARPGLLLMNGWVYAAFGSHCDHTPYAGWVAGVNVTSKKLTLWTDESGVTNNQAGIWQSGGGVMSDGPGRIIVTSGNGISPAYGPGTKPPGTLAESVIRLAVDPTTGNLSAADFFSPNNAPALDAADRDFGSGSPVGLPFGVSGGSTAYPDLMVQAGKDGRIFILNRDSLGGRNGTNSGALFTSASYAGLWGHPAVFADTDPLTAANAAAAHDYLFYVGNKDVVRVFKFGVSSTGKPTLSDVANGGLVYGYTSGSPVVTSHGTDATSAVLWQVYSTGASGANSVLKAYDMSSTALSGCSAAHPCGLKRIFNAPIGQSVKFSPIATSGGMVYVGTRDGHLLAFGPPLAAAPLTATATTLAPTAVSTTSTKTVTVTAKHATTVTAVDASTGATNAAASGAPAPATSQFTVAQVTKTHKGSTVTVTTFPVKLAKGDVLHATVAFTPSVPGAIDGTLAVTDNSTTEPVVNVPLAGDGTQPGLFASPATVTFPLAPQQGVIPVPVGTSVPATAVLSNFGTIPYIISSVTPPSGPFSFTAGGVAPTAGQEIRPGQSIAVTVSFTPTGAGNATGSFTITGGGLSTTIHLAGIGTAAISAVTAPTINFGTIAVGKTATLYVHVTNTGNTPTLVVGTVKLPTPFNAVLTPQPGLPFNPSNDMDLPVSFTPKKPGSFTAHYQLQWHDLEGSHTLDVLLTGTAV